MDTTRLLSSLLGGVLGARPKSHGKAARFLKGSSGSLWNARTLLSVGALGWAAYEIYRSKSGAHGATTNLPGQRVDPGTTIVSSVPPRIPPPVSAVSSTGSSTGVGGTTRTPPPLPATTGAAALAATGAGMDPTRRLVGVLLAAARSDGELGEVEYGRLLTLAREAGGADLVGAELRSPTPLEALAGGIPEPRARADLYRLAFGIVRCDEDVQPREREWLTRLARALELDPSAISNLESEVARGIALS